MRSFQKLMASNHSTNTCQIVGVFLGAYSGRDPVGHKANMTALLKMWHDAPLRPYVSATYALEDAGKALRDMADRKALGKLVVLTDAGQRGAQ